MKRCNKCGNLVDDYAIFCIHCGARTNGSDSHREGANSNPYGQFYNSSPYQTYHVVDETESFGLTVLSAFFWYVGIILWLFMRRTRPGKARSALKGTLFSTSLSMPIFGLVGWLLWRRDPSYRGYAKACGLGALIGGALYATMFVLSVAFKALGISYDMFTSTTPFIEDFLGSMSMYIGQIFKI